MFRSSFRRTPAACVALLAAAALIACEPAPAVTPATSDRTAAAASGAPSAEHWRSLARTRVFFGHQSVGGNLLEGVDALLRETPGAGVRVVAIDSTATGREPATPGTIAHFHVGENGQPARKLADFAATLDSSAADGGVALMKFCYLDMRAGSNPEALFEEYQRMVAAVRARHPGLTLVHVTMPVTTVESGPKALLKSAMGKVTSRELNRRRERYNTLLRRAYGEREPLFDLARLESVGPDGRVHSVRVDGETVPVLAPEYTDDGGHLNARGQRAGAEQLLRVLAAAAAR